MIKINNRSAKLMLGCGFATWTVLAILGASVLAANSCIIMGLFYYISGKDPLSFNHNK